MRSGGRARCEAAAAAWGGIVQLPRATEGGPQLPEGPPLVLFAYDRSLHSQNPKAPVVPETLIQAVRDQEHAARRYVLDGRRIVEALVPMPWSDGPCAMVLARGPSAPRRLNVPPVRAWVIPMLVGFAALLLAVGPIVARVRRLTEAVQRSARTGYTGGVPVGGRDEIADLARAFDDASRQIRAQLADRERREQALREFLANTTHDMMIPLTVLQGHLAALDQRADPGAAAIISAAMDEAHYMASLMHNLAIAAKLDADAPRVLRGPVDLNALIGRVVARHTPIARQLEVGLDAALPEEPVITDGDVTLLEQAVSNVVYNAIRHNRKAGHVAVILERAGGERFRLQVIDDGPGIPADELSRLLERGFRGGAARTRVPEGQGLGLHITFRVAQLHDLKLDLGPSPYGGLQVDLVGAVAAAPLD